MNQVTALKADMRRRVAAIIAAMTPEERRARSALALKHLQTQPEWLRAQRVMLFVSLPDEVDTLPMIRAALAAGKEVYVPKVVRAGRRMKICRLRDLAELQPGALGIGEPQREDVILPAQLDLVLVPARAFDCHGNRLGRSGGYYDRFLSDPALRAAALGITYDCQFFDCVPTHLGDVPLRYIVTESGVVGRTVPTRGLFPGDALRTADAGSAGRGDAGT